MSLYFLALSMVFFGFTKLGYFISRRGFGNDDILQICIYSLFFILSTSVFIFSFSIERTQKHKSTKIAIKIIYVILCILYLFHLCFLCYAYIHITILVFNAAENYLHYFSYLSLINDELYSTFESIYYCILIVSLIISFIYTLYDKHKKRQRILPVKP